MASAEEEISEFSGRRTRSGKKVPTAQYPPASSTRPTRRSSKKQVIAQEISEVYSDDNYEEHQKIRRSVEEVGSADQSDIIQEMLAEAAQGVIVHNGDEEDQQVMENVIFESYETVIEEEIVQDDDDCIVYEDQALGEQVQHLDEDVEMYTEQVVESEVPNISETGIDEKSSSFPFGTVGQSETSEDNQNEEEVCEEVNNETSTVESSLLASLAGDNANSLPSVGGSEETEKKNDFETKCVEHIQPNCEKMDSSDDSLSEPAIAEDIANSTADGSNATIVNTEMVSEDELPLPTKPEINDAEEVSDEELPAPKRAELPADAEVISEDELPTNAINSGNTESGVVRNKRKAVEEDNSSKSEHDVTDNNEKKKKSDEQYNPMSPTSESNDSPPVEKRSKLENETEHKEKKKDKDKEKEREKDKEKEKERKRLPDLDKYWRAVKEDSADFTAWTYLLQYVDNESDAEAAREAYDAFLSHYPYCYGYWRKYADYEKRKGIKTNCNLVFERGLESIPLSVDLWIHYLTHVRSTQADNVEYIRSQFERAIEACGLEFRSDKLWDAYIKWENDAKRYNRVLQIYDRLLAIPTQGYSGHFDNFQDLINQHSLTTIFSSEELKQIRTEMRSTSFAKSSASRSKSRHDSKEKDESSKASNTSLIDESSKSPHREVAEHEEAVNDGEIETSVVSDDSFKDISTLNEEEISAIKEKIISIRRKVHKNTVAAVTARWSFEEGIKRPYFHVKPLERCQLKNWKDYLDFEIEKGDRKRIIVLFERCLIACALYDEFWLKMIRYLETSLEEPGSVELTSDVFRRACEIHHPDKPSMHLMWAAFEECQTNFDRAAEILVNLERKCPNLLQVAYRRINVERRRGDLKKCRELYEHYISIAKNKTIAGSLAIKYARFLNKICNDLDGGLKVLKVALEKDPANTRVALQMVDLALQRPEVDEEEVVLIMDKFMARENIDPEQKVLFAQRKVEFLEDFGSTAQGLQDAQRSLQLALNKANEAKKKRESSPSRKSSGVSSKDAAAQQSSATTQSYNNTSSVTNTNYYNPANAAYYGQQQGNSAYQQQSYDGYYNQWQYGSGYSSYGQWSGYGNYY